MIRTPIFLLLIFLFTSCATVEEAIDAESGTVDTEDVDPRPDWYDYSNRAYADSAFFYGVGLASSDNENGARVEAEKQAIANLKLSIDSHAENIRAELAEQSGGDRFSSRSFIMNLRNSVQELTFGSELEMTHEHFEKSDSVHNVYAKTAISREKALSALGVLIDVPEFIQALNESMDL